MDQDIEPTGAAWSCWNDPGGVIRSVDHFQPLITMAKKQRIPHKFLPWIDARKKFRLSNAHIQMARELGLSPKRFGSYADTTNQPWKSPLPQFIEQLYFKQFGKERPDVVLSMEEIAASHVAKRAERKTAKQETQPEPGQGSAQ